LKKKLSRGANSSTARPALDRGVYVGEAVGEREGELLGRVRAGLADVVAGDRDRVPERQLARAQNSTMSVTSRIDGSGGKIHSFWAMYSLRMSVWIVPRSSVRSTPCCSATQIVEGEQHRRRAV